MSKATLVFKTKAVVGKTPKKDDKTCRRFSNKTYRVHNSLSSKAKTLPSNTHTHTCELNACTDIMDLQDFEPTSIVRNQKAYGKQEVFTTGTHEKDNIFPV